MPRKPKIERVTGVVTDPPNAIGFCSKRAVTHFYRGDEIEETRIVDLGYFTGTLEEFFDKVREIAQGLNEPRFTTEYVWGSYGESDKEMPAIIGWKTMTPEDKAERDLLRNSIKETQRKKERTEREQYEKLKQKFEGR